MNQPNLLKRQAKQRQINHVYRAYKMYPDKSKKEKAHIAKHLDTPS